MFGDDPVQAFTDRYDSGTTASGRPTNGGGIAVNVPGLGWRESWRRYGHGWWWVCPPRSWRRHCTLLKQTDAGPSAAGRVLDLTTVAARRAWGLAARGFPTDVGTWTLRYRGHR